MSAGVLTYQLCDREFDCSDCPLDKAMRNIVREQDAGDRLRLPLRIDPLRLGRYYTTEHCWIAIRSSDTIRIGLDPNLAHRCAGLIGISLPTVGREVPARVPVVWIRFTQGMIPVRLPIAVHITGVNRRVHDDPELLMKDPYDDGWLFDARITPAHLEECRLMSSWTAEKVYSRDEQSFVQQVRDAGGVLPKETGQTAYDGGGIIPTIVSVLGAGRYCAIIAQVYCKT